MADKILVPVDGSELSDRILVHVQRLLSRAEAEVVLFHVGPEGTQPVDRRHVDELAASLRANGANARALVVRGEPASMILAAAREIGPNLVAMSTHGRSGVMRFIRGSVAERVLRHSPVPVLLANPLALPERQRPEIRRILVPLDGSELSAEILPIASDVAELFGAELVLLGAIELVVTPDPVVMVSPAVDREGLEARLAELAKRVSVPVTTRVVLGTPAVEILDAAHDADLVALATHGRSGPSRWAFGSVAEQVVRHCDRPLLVKRTGGAIEKLMARERAAQAAT